MVSGDRGGSEALYQYLKIVYPVAAFGFCCFHCEYESCMPSSHMVDAPLIILMVIRYLLVYILTRIEKYPEEIILFPSSYQLYFVLQPIRSSALVQPF